MDYATKKRCADLLRTAANQTIIERDFWTKFKGMEYCRPDPIAAIAYESSVHYWGNFHERSVFFLIPTKSDRWQLQNGRNELNLIADALEGDWPLEELRRKLANI